MKIAGLKRSSGPSPGAPLFILILLCLARCAGDGERPPDCSFAASPAIIQVGQSTTLSWACPGGATVSIEELEDNLPAAGSLLVRPLNTRTYLLTGEWSEGVALQKLTVTVVGDLPPTCRRGFNDPVGGLVFTLGDASGVSDAGGLVNLDTDDPGVLLVGGFYKGVGGAVGRASLIAFSGPLGWLGDGKTIPDAPVDLTGFGLMLQEWTASPAYPESYDPGAFEVVRDTIESGTLVFQQGGAPNIGQTAVGEASGRTVGGRTFSIDFSGPILSTTEPLAVERTLLDTDLRLAIKGGETDECGARPGTLETREDNNISYAQAEIGCLVTLTGDENLSLTFYGLVSESTTTRITLDLRSGSLPLDEIADATTLSTGDVLGAEIYSTLFLKREIAAEEIESASITFTLGGRPNREELALGGVRIRTVSGESLSFAFEGELLCGDSPAPCELYFIDRLLDAGLDYPDE